MKNFKNKVIVITGAGSGIGRALANEFHKKGAQLALCDYDEQGLNETTSSIKSAYAEVLDVSKKESVFKFRDNVINQFKQVDIVINNAGVALGQLSFREMTLEQFEWVVNINLWGVIYGSKAFIEDIVQRPEGCVVNISSLFGIIGVPEQTAYCATKFAVRGFSEALRIELSNTNVNVVSVHPGGIKTNILHNSKGWKKEVNKEEQIKKIYKKAFKHTPEKAAKTIIKGIEQKKGRVLIGEEAVLMDLAARSAPENYTAIIDKVIKFLDR